MSPELYLAYVVACTALLFVPGPTLLLVISYSLAHGRRSAFAVIGGVLLGDTVALTVSLLGVGALLMASARLFIAVKFSGAVYLVYLGLKMWRSSGTVTAAAMDAPFSPMRTAADAFTVTVLNPKSGVFFVAFLPQFMEPAAPILPQTFVLGGTFLFLAFASVTLYALVAIRVRRRLSDTRIVRALNRVGGGALVGAGVFAAVTR
jgi:threonine/homoserine/homoserine lactone efflux protein